MRGGRDGGAAFLPGQAAASNRASVGWKAKSKVTTDPDCFARPRSSSSVLSFLPSKREGIKVSAARMIDQGAKPPGPWALLLCFDVSLEGFRESRLCVTCELSDSKKKEKPAMGKRRMLRRETSASTQVLPGVGTGFGQLKEGWGGTLAGLRCRIVQNFNVLDRIGITCSFPLPNPPIQFNTCHSSSQLRRANIQGYTIGLL